MVLCLKIWSYAMHRQCETCLIDLKTRCAKKAKVVSCHVQLQTTMPC